jgi:hypothetical protein
MARDSRLTATVGRALLSRGRTQSEGAQAPSPESRDLGSRMAFSRAVVLRIAAHIAAWIPFIYGAVASMQSGWRPVSDDAGIAVRSWDVLTTYGPLVGQPSRLASGVYDLGPLEYWLLAIPTHLDPGHGSLWGATVWCIIAASLAIEAGWSVARGLGAVLASATILAVVLWIPAVATDSLWNPWFGAPFFVAAFAAAWAVMCGRRGWWPVVVIAASIAAQAHLTYAIASAALIAVAFAVGLADTIRARARYWWLVAGVAAAVACWAAPLVQQFNHQPGNISAIFNGRGATGHQAGFTFGLKSIAAAARIPPVSWERLESLPGIYPVGRDSAALGVVILILLAAIAVAAARYLRSRRVVMLAVLGLVASVAMAITLARLATSDISLKRTGANNLNYLLTPMIMVGVLIWLTVGTFLVLLARRVISQARAPAPVPQKAQQDGSDETAATDSQTPAEPAPARPGVARRAAVRLAAVGATAIVLLAGLTSWATASVAGKANTVTGLALTVDLAARRIEARLPNTHTFQLAVSTSDKHIKRRVTFGLVYALNSAGYLPQVSKVYAWQLGSVYEKTGQTMPQVRVFVTGNSVTVRITRPSASAGGS